MSDNCPKCHQPWELHEFGVPAPYCPIVSPPAGKPDRPFDINQPIVKNVKLCDLCGSPMHRYYNRFQCEGNPSHIADLFTGITTSREDLSRRFPFVWIGRLGFGFCLPGSFARSRVSPWGPYGLWFAKVIGPIYWARSLPEKWCGARMV